jgi:Zn-dependent peptidase ImmA (M78 family)
MREKLPINPETLRWARESANILLEDVALKMKREVSIIENWEAGASSPTYVQLEKLAYEVYKRPIAVFFLPTPPSEETPQRLFRTLPESEISELPPRFLRLFRKAQAMQINLEEINDGINPFPRKIFEDIIFTPSVSLQEMVRIVREYLNVDLQTQIGWNNTDLALKEWRKAIEAKGVFVFKDAFRLEDISGFCLYDKQFPVIYLNNSTPNTRQIFTLFHELPHLLFRISGIDLKNEAFLRKIGGENKQIEVLCNKFAGEFLVPSDDFRQSVRNTHIDDRLVEQLANRYKVSREVILRKCLDKNLVSQDYYETKSAEWSAEARKRMQERKGGDYYLNTVAYLGENYLNAVFNKYYQGRFPIEQLADYLGVKLSSISGLEQTLLSKG